MATERDQHGNVVLLPDHYVVAVWRGTPLGDALPEDVVQHFKECTSSRVQYLENVETLPDRDKYGERVQGTGGRSDMLIAVHAADIGKFSAQRFRLGNDRPVWLSDLDLSIYPERVRQYLPPKATGQEGVKSAM